MESELRRVRNKYGRQTALLLPNGVESAVKISQGFNQYGELTQFQVNNHNPLNLSYDKLGRQLVTKPKWLYFS